MLGVAAGAEFGFYLGTIICPGYGSLIGWAIGGVAYLTIKAASEIFLERLAIMEAETGTEKYEPKTED